MPESFYVKSRLTGKNYDCLQTVNIKNLQQVAGYIENGVFPVDIKPARDKDNKRFLVFVFNKASTKEVFDKWCKYELE